MADKNLNSRIIHKHDTEANWNKAANFVPKQGELIVYDIDSNYSYERFKIGDGKTIASALPFADAQKVDKVEGKQLSTNDFTTAEKTKLAGIAAGAQVNTITGVKGNSETSYRTGNVNITKANIGLGNVDNTADANKSVASAAKLTVNGGSATQPVYFANGVPTKTTYTLGTSVPADAKFTDTTYSAATQTAAGLLSAADKKKLDGIESGAEVNQNAFANIKIGSSTLASNDKQGYVEFIAGSNITLTPDTANNKLTISATNTTYSNATQSTAGLMSATDKIKLDGLKSNNSAVTVAGEGISGTMTLNGDAEISLPLSVSGRVWTGRDTPPSSDYVLWIPESSSGGDESEGVVPVIGLPAGGTTGQVLAKNSSVDGDVSWQDSNLSSYLPLSGGTMTGTIIMPSNLYVSDNGNGGLNMNNSDISGLNCLYFKDESGSAGEGIHFYRSATTTDVLWAKGGAMYWTPNYSTATTNYTVLTSANFSLSGTTLTITT